MKDNRLWICWVWVYLPSTFTSSLVNSGLPKDEDGGEYGVNKSYKEVIYRLSMGHNGEI